MYLLKYYVLKTILWHWHADRDKREYIYIDIYIYNIYDIFDVQSHSKTVSHINIITTLQKHHLAACAVRPCSSCKTSSSGNSSHYPNTSLLHADWFAPGCQPPWNPKKHMNWLGQWHWPGNMTSQHMLALVEAAVVAKCCKSGLTSRWS